MTLRCISKGANNSETHIVITEKKSVLSSYLKEKNQNAKNPNATAFYRLYNLQG